MSAVSIHLGCAILRAIRSCSNECPSKMVLESNNLSNRAWIMGSVVVILARCSSVIPEYLSSNEYESRVQIKEIYRVR